ncbi:MAG: dUTP diphosphatase [Chloroflexi bacterium]|nr:dUTP diphosphatase [Chloroflexota bacterium]MCL5074850.1 dUTP diphosphatase [Chloroflexota bacterium]
MQVAFKRADEHLAAYYRAYATDAGADLIALEETVIEPLATQKIATNMAMAIPEGYYGMITGRSGLAAQGLFMHVGTVDSGYRGLISVVLTNMGQRPFHIKRGDRIAQLIILPFLSPDFVEVAMLPSSERSDRGWGSSGV